MAKLYGKIGPRKIKALSGKVDVYLHKRYGWLARAWPNATRPTPSPLWQKTAQAMRDAWKVIKRLTRENKDAYKRCLGTGVRTWVDVAKSASLSAPVERQRLLNPTDVHISRLSPTAIRLHFTRDYLSPNPVRWKDMTFFIRWSTLPEAHVSFKSYGSTGDCKKDAQMPPQCEYDPTPYKVKPVHNDGSSPYFSAALTIPPENSNLYWIVNDKNRHGHYRPISGIQINEIPPL